MFTYSIKGQVTYNEADTKTGFETINIDEVIHIDDMSAEAAKDKFFADNEQYDFFGSLMTCDAKTYGKKGATFSDQGESQIINVELIDE